MIGQSTRSVSDRVWRSYADIRRVVRRDGSTARPDAVFDGADRSQPERWTEQLADRHVAYRAAVAPAPGDVTVVCVSTRPHLIATLVGDVAAEHHAGARFVLVANDARYDSVDLDSLLAPLADAGITSLSIRRPPEDSLGACLNAGMDSTDTRFVAKFDDDDRYGPHYLDDALRAHAYAGAGIVGKHTYYAHLVQEAQMVLRFPANEYRYSSTLAGGTLVLDRERTGDLRFPDISLGEDRALIAACHRRGIPTFSADRFNFVQTRSADNTWRMAVTDFVEKSVTVDGLDLDDVNR